MTIDEYDSVSSVVLLGLFVVHNCRLIIHIYLPFDALI